MKHTTTFLIVSLWSLIFLSGCGRIIDWATDTFYQIEQYECPSNVPAYYIRSVVAYDQFTTVAMFDALWLSDDVRTAYTNAYMLKYGKSEERRKAFLRRQLEENKHYISFYVLSSYRMVLGDPQSNWSIFLNIDDTFFSPIEVKAVDLDPVYESFFGKKFNEFKIAYLVKFDAKDSNDQYLINSATQCIELVFRTTCREVELTWEFENGVVVIDCKDYKEPVCR